MKKHLRTIISLFLPCIALISFQTNLCLAQWTSDHLSEPKWQVFSAAAGKKVVFAAGSKGANTSSPNTVEIYDVETKEFTYHTLSQGRSRPGMTSAGGKIFIAGGYKLPIGASSANNSKIIDIYDTESGNWSQSQLSVARFSIGAAAVGNKVLFAGGISISSGANVFYDVIDVYDIVTEDWDTLYLSQPRAEIAVVTIGQKVLFAGGNNNDHPSSDVVDIYDAATNTMLAPTQLSIPRNWPAATAVGKYALIAGGGHFVNPTTVEWSDVVDIWNSETGEWSTSSLSLPRAFMTAGTIGNRAYFAGGGEVDLSIGFYNTSTARVDIFDSSTGLWSTDEMPSARTTCYGTVSCNQLFVPGGWYPEGPQILSDVLIYTDSSFSCISGVQDIFGENLLVAPNPVREELQLINLDTDIFDRFEIFNLAGHSMHQQNTQPQSGKINVADLPAGFYLLRLSTRTGHTVNRTFVKA